MVDFSGKKVTRIKVLVWEAEAVIEEAWIEHTISAFSVSALRFDCRLAMASTVSLVMRLQLSFGSDTSKCVLAERAC